MWSQRGQQFVEVVGFRDRDAEFLQQRLEILLGALLTVKADQVMQGGFFRARLRAPR